MEDIPLSSWHREHKKIRSYFSWIPYTPCVRHCFIFLYTGSTRPKRLFQLKFTSPLWKSFLMIFPHGECKTIRAIPNPYTPPVEDNSLSSHTWSTRPSEAIPVEIYTPNAMEDTPLPSHIGSATPSEAIPVKIHTPLPVEDIPLSSHTVSICLVGLTSHVIPSLWLTIEFGSSDLPPSDAKWIACHCKWA